MSSVTDAALQCVPARPKSALAPGMSPFSGGLTNTDSSIASDMDSEMESPEMPPPSPMSALLAGTQNFVTEGLNTTTEGLAKGGKGLLNAFNQLDEYGKDIITGGPQKRSKAATTLAAAHKGKVARKEVAKLKLEKEPVVGCVLMLLTALGCRQPSQLNLK